MSFLAVNMMTDAERLSLPAEVLLAWRGLPVLCTDTGHMWTWTGAAWQDESPGGSPITWGIAGAAGANLVQGLVNFGPGSGRPEGDTASVTIPATWVTATSKIVCAPQSYPADHDPEDVVVEGIEAYAINLVPGVSFDVEAYAPSGSWGRYYVNAIGA
jgi:hypothetical protein